MADKPKAPTPTLSEEEKQRIKEENFQAKQNKAADTAPTTKKTMGSVFKKGGVVRGSGCEQRGKTRGKMV